MGKKEKQMPSSEKLKAALWLNRCSVGSKGKKGTDCWSNSKVVEAYYVNEPSAREPHAKVR